MQCFPISQRPPIRRSSRMKENDPPMFVVPEPAIGILLSLLFICREWDSMGSELLQHRGIYVTTAITLSILMSGISNDRMKAPHLARCIFAIILHETGCFCSTTVVVQRREQSAVICNNKIFRQNHLHAPALSSCSHPVRTPVRCCNYGWSRLQHRTGLFWFVH